MERPQPIDFAVANCTTMAYLPPSAPGGGYIEIDALRSTLSGREHLVLDAMGIAPPPHGHILCPFPSHKNGSPSWRWRFNRRRFICTCGSGDIFDVVRQVRGGGFMDSVRFVASVMGIDDAPTTIAKPPNRESPARERRSKKRWSHYAEDQWRSCMPLSDDALDYLNARCCAIPPRNGDLRWHPDLPNKLCDYTGPALVARVTDAVTGEPLTIHRTWIQPDGTKAPISVPRLILKDHAKKGGVIRLWPDDEVTLGLAVAEGIENALSAARGFTPAWSMLDKGNLAGFPVLTGIQALTIVADPDDGGMRSADQCARRWRDAGKEVRLWPASQAGMDFNDWIRK